MRAFEFNEETVMAVSLELSADLRVIEREVETLYDLLSDLGGIESIIVTLFALIVAPFSKGNLDAHIASQLY